MTIKMGNWEDYTKGDTFEDGWYAVLWCYDGNEGVFPDAAEFRNGEFIHHAPIFKRSPNKFETSVEAHKWAYDNDPDM